MRKILCKLIITLLILSFNSLAFAADQRGTSSKPSVGAVVADILVLRPLGFVGTVLGGAAFMVSLPVTLPSHKVDSTAKVLVEQPFNYTFERPFGQM